MAYRLENLRILIVDDNAHIRQLLRTSRNDEVPMAENGHSNGAYQLITPPNLLKVKVGGQGGKGIDADAIHRASSAIAYMADEFGERVALEIAMLVKLSHDLDNDPSRSDKIGAKVLRIAREVAGQGETFGFNLISKVGESMSRYVANPVKTSEPLNGDVLRAHADAMRAVIKNRVKGDGGQVGLRACRESRAACGSNDPLSRFFRSPLVHRGWPRCYPPAMPAHLIKLAVGIESIDHLRQRQQDRIAERKAAGHGPILRILTRNTPASCRRTHRGRRLHILGDQGPCAGAPADHICRAGRGP